MADATCKECGTAFKAQRRSDRTQQYCCRDCIYAAARRKGCAFPRCPGRHAGLGWCSKHLRRWRQHGDPAITLHREYQRIPGATLEERFWAKVDKGDGTGCWLWTGSPASSGYGRLRLGDRNSPYVLAHRFAYELLVEPIPDGLTLDHVKANGCISTACVKAIADEHGPAHLEPVTMRVNNLRGDSRPAQNARKTHCKRGHPFDEANTYVTPEGCRQCRTCHRARQRARYVISS